MAASGMMYRTTQAQPVLGLQFLATEWEVVTDTNNFLLVVFFHSALACWQQQKRARPRDVLLSICSDPQVSPDGKWVAYVVTLQI